MFAIELFICIKMNLALNNLQRLICDKTKQNKTSLKCADLYIVGYQLLLLPCSILSVLLEIIRGIRASNIFFSYLYGEDFLHH